MQFSPVDPHLLLTAGGDGTARTWRIPDSTLLTGTWGRVQTAKVSDDGRQILTAGDGLIKIWDTQGRLLATRFLSGHGYVTRGVFTPGANTVVLAGEASTAPVLWNWRDPKAELQLDAQTNTGGYYLTGALAVSPDGGRIAAGDRDNRVVLWDLGSRRIAATLTADASDIESISALAFVPGSTRLVAASTDGTARIWDTTSTAAPALTLGRVGDPPLGAVAVSPDGSRIATAAGDQTIRIWDSRSGSLVGTLLMSAGQAISLASRVLTARRSRRAARTLGCTFGTGGRATRSSRSGGARVFGGGRELLAGRHQDGVGERRRNGRRLRLHGLRPYRGRRPRRPAARRRGPWRRLTLADCS